MKSKRQIVFLYRAGVGRTGTFIAIEGCLRQMEQDKRVDIFGAVCKMRRQRNFMVQTEVWSQKLSKQWYFQGVWTTSVFQN